jgi:uncharacterized UBP type Zn finger protein
MHLSFLEDFDSGSLNVAPADKSRAGNNQNQNKKGNYMNEPCEHLKNLTEGNFTRPRVPLGCEECLKVGTRWIALRQCMACGHVGCCDSSIGKHATKHYHKTQHPVMRSVMAGDRWTWCYVHEIGSELAPAIAMRKQELQRHGG